MHERQQKQRIHRRDVLMTASASAVMLAAGCRAKKAEEAKPTAERRDVPLRIAMVGRGQDAEILTRAWASVMSQPLKFETVDISRQAAGGLSQLSDLAKKNDLLIHPLLAIPDLVVAESIVAFTGDEFATAAAELGQVYAAVKNGAAMYAGDLVAVPLGARLPALIATDRVDRLATWADYDRWVSDLDGAGCEPLAPGWAGSMFLWRAASTLETGWLFAREGLTPLVDAQPYIDVLTQMRQTADRYQAGRMAPQEIWAGIQAGKLRGGICFQADAEEETPVSVVDLPGAANANRVLLDPFSPVVSISSACRQTGASKQFANWLSGGEGSDSVRRQISGMTATRKNNSDAPTPSQQQGGVYDRWLRRRLEVPVALPAMQLLSGGKYYDVLDQQVGRCLDGATTPEAALGEVAGNWRALNDSVGLEKQERAWRRAQGMRA